MTGLFRKAPKPEPSRASLLAAVPLQHPRARVRSEKTDTLQLEIPVAKRWLARRLTRSDAPILRRFELDALGAEVWRMLDGMRNVRALIEEFARRHHLNLREAEVAMLRYLQTLASRGMILFQVDGDDRASDHERESDES